MDIKKIVCLCLILQHINVLGQTKWDYGFNLEFLNNTSTLKSSKNFTSLIPTSVSALGFGLGFGIYYRINDKAELGIFPSMNFIDDKIRYHNSNFDTTLVWANSNLALPIHLIYSPFKNKLSLKLGTSIYYDIMKRIEFDPIDKMDLEKINISGDLGLQYNFYFGKVIVIPELRYSHGFINLIDDQRTDYGRSIECYYRHKVSLIFNFRDNKKITTRE